MNHLREIALIGIAFIFHTSLSAQLDMGGGGGSTPEKYVNQGQIEKFSKTQKKFQNKVVFSSTKIEKMQEDQSTFKSEFKLGDPIFYRAYHDETIESKGNSYAKSKTDQINNAFYQDFAIGYFISINNNEPVNYARHIKSEERILSWSTASGALFDPNNAKLNTGYLSVALKKAFNALGNDFKPGKYEIEIKAYVYPSVAVAEESRDQDKIEFLYEGRLTINATEEGIKKYLPALCKTLKKPANAINNEELEKDILDNFNAFYKDKTAKIVYITSESWFIKRNGVGKTLYKSIYSKVVYQNDKGETRWMDYVVKKDFDGEDYKNIQTMIIPDPNDEPICPLCIDWYNEK